ncbi:aspartate/glutamate racemase family protein [Kineococcus gynurae]|uniref:Aspartate/glutamate racemase family protein n=1 Tax=Kineococcus gynurae TaxID=452979 RepID=A0ABV5LV96_9ACTN
MTVVGLLHSEHEQARIFAALLAQRDPEVQFRHLVDRGLLNAARRSGIESVRPAMADRLRRLQAEGADLVVCTGSTLSGLAKVVGDEIGVEVLRVDRPMAEAAVRAGRRLAVVATLPTAARSVRELLHEAAGEADRRVEVVEVDASDLWILHEVGDAEGYVQGIAQRALTELRGADDVCTVDVVVLAQASMVEATPLLRPLSVPVLSSPRLAVEAAVELVRTLAPAAGRTR